MEKYFGEKQERFSFRKLSVGLVSATISSLFFMSVLASSSVDAQETAGVHYKCGRFRAIIRRKEAACL
ncbi:immunoglobulin A1 protease [Streptococcus pneumoniae]|nr:immunoglobulin A1 protease [Streptococcus pneumoniae]CJQ43820.1 immunoglobulin A1 protease [Streptococcus pneumoniae]CJY00564.1 immunoglobulin A1 protease [Streptococcus pneumoniae]